MSARKPNSLKALCLALAALLLYGSKSPAQDQTVGLFLNMPGATPGYTLFAPVGSTTTYLIDSYGRLVHTWPSSYRPALSAYLLENGNLLRTASMTDGGGGFELIAWDGTLLWSFEYFDEVAGYQSHHDVEQLPNGNVLVLVRDIKSLAEAEQAGRDPSLLTGARLNVEYVIEVDQTGPTTGDIVWEWHLWDHLIQDFDPTKDNYGSVSEHPELVDINFAIDGRAEWLHGNSIAYNAELDQIVISYRNLGEIMVIDHSTTTAEAASHSGGARGIGGDILYRWGNPQSYRAGTPDDQQLFVQHDACWIPDDLPGGGNLLVFNNGTGRPDGDYSSVEEISSPVDSEGEYPILTPGTSFGPVSPTWTYAAEGFYSPHISGSQRLSNGNTLICEGNSGRFIEVIPDGTILWEYIVPLSRGNAVAQGDPITRNNVFKCYRYPADYPGLVGKDLTPGAPIEIYPLSISGTAHAPVSPAEMEPVTVTTTITDDVSVAIAEIRYSTGGDFVAIPLLDDGAHGDGAPGDNLFGAVIPAQSNGTTVAYYVYAEDDDLNSVSDPYSQPVTTYRYATPSCCENRVGDANGEGGDEPTIGDISVMIDAKFISGICYGVVACLSEADINQTGGQNVQCTDITIGDITILIDYLFITGKTLGLPDCL